MRYGQLLLKTNKEAREYDSINATLLTKGGYIDQTMAGVYTFLPLGWRVLNKIENIIREEMNNLGVEMLMPALSPKALWQATDRLDIDILLEARGASRTARDKNDGVYILNPTHEEIITPVVQRIKLSYRDLPFAAYQVQTKYRNEARPKSGLLRGREFRMKDLYSFHADEADLHRYYEEVKRTYERVFERIGIGDDTVIALASGGDFTAGFSHEFDTLCATGEDTVYWDEAQGIYYNAEVAPDDVKKKSETMAVSEVGNIFPLGTKFAQAFDYHFVDQTGQRQLVWMASYGIGSSRVMGVLVEKYHDEAGIIWPESVEPFQMHLIGLNLEEKAVRQRAEQVYEQLKSAGLEVLFDDRLEGQAGEKLADADLLGIPWRVVVSKRTEKEKVEVKRRDSDETKFAQLSELIRLAQ